MDSQRVTGSSLESIGNSVRFVACGDVVMHLPIVSSCLQPDGSYNFRPIFAGLKSTLATADIATCVLETPLDVTTGHYTGYPAFNAPGAVADGLQWAGFDLVFTAHNHCLDRGWWGIRTTVAYLAGIGLPQVGIRISPAAPRYRLVTIKGLRIAFLAYTTATNGIPPPEGRKWAVNFFDYASIATDIAAARRAGADCIVMALHTGIEYQRLPGPQQRQMADRLLRMGVDIVLGSHVHVIEPWERRFIFDLVHHQIRSCFVAYSLGNLLSNQRWRFSDCGLMITFELQKKLGGGVNIAKVTSAPLWVYRFREKGKSHYQIVKVDSADGPINDLRFDAAARQRVREVWQDTYQLVSSWRQQRAILPSL